MHVLDIVSDLAKHYGWQMTDQGHDEHSYDWFVYNHEDLIVEIHTSHGHLTSLRHGEVGRDGYYNAVDSEMALLGLAAQWFSSVVR